MMAAMIALRRWLDALACAACLALAALGLAAAPGSAAARTLPYGAMGVQLEAAATDPAIVGDSALDAQLGLMARSGVESLRTVLAWRDAEPLPGVYRWRRADRIVRAAARHGIELLPLVIETPQWASERPIDSRFNLFVPRDPRMLGRFLRAAVRRYGPRGRFWRANRRIPYRPIRRWQVYNEPSHVGSYKSQPWTSTLPPLLAAAHAALHAADPGAVLVAPAFAGTPGNWAWDEVRQLYAAGAKGSFDAIAINQYTTGDDISVDESVQHEAMVLANVLDEIRKAGDAGTPVYLTEFGWTAALGKLPSSRVTGFETTPAGQAQRLSAFYQWMAQDRPAGLARAYWYTWGSSYDATDPNRSTFDFSGLTRWTPGAPFTPLPLLDAYRRSAIRWEGCAKSSDARRCAS